MEQLEFKLEKNIEIQENLENVLKLTLPVNDFMAIKGNFWIHSESGQLF